MFMGEFRHNLDDKGRLIIPSKFRKQLFDKFVLTRGLDGCLFGYPLNEWQRLEEKLRKLPLSRKDARYFARFFYSAATEVEFDRQGRINISASLRIYAELKKECVIVGVANRIEIWNISKWDKILKESSESFEDITENMTDFGL